MITRSAPERYITQRNFAVGIVAAAIAVVVGFFIYEFRFLRAPGLTLTIPSKDITVTENFLDITGRGDPETDLTVNGRPLYSGKTGEFSERMYLSRGVNRLEFEAKNRYGRVTRLIRYVVAK